MNHPAPPYLTPRFGPLLTDSGEVCFRLYAPSVAHLELLIDGAGTLPMQARDHGWFEITCPCAVGARYAFVLPDGQQVPDPASRAQSEDANGFSLVIDHSAYRWQEQSWRGRPWHESVIYELHVGLMGGFRGVTARLAELAGLGITSIELMPIADFDGQHNWGYDGVLLFAPDRAYGTPEDLKQLIDTAHALHLSVILDVVYNHFGPSGNYLHAYAADFFRDDVHTPWGPGLDFRRADVRDFYTENALYWLSEYRFDGLRLDAVHAIEDAGWLTQLPKHLRAALPQRQIHLIVENENNDAKLLESGFDAQWNDDVHHTIHVMLTGEREAYYEDYAAAPAAQLARALAEGFAYQGEPSPHRGGKKRGTPSAHLPPQSFVSFLQNHDQIGNRARGERLGQLTTPEQLAAAFTLILLAPQIPLLFMGEETNSHAPFYFFADYHGELADAVRRGRRAEFARFSAFEKLADAVPDPTALATFQASRVEWIRPAHANAATLRHMVLLRTLLTLRNHVLVPRFSGCQSVFAEPIGHHAVFAQWRLNDGQTLCLLANLGATDEPITQVIASDARVLFESTDGAAALASSERLLAGAAVAWLSPADGAARRKRAQ